MHMYPVKMSVRLVPVGEPAVSVSVMGKAGVIDCCTLRLGQQQNFHFEFESREPCCLIVTHHDKLINDASTAVIVHSVEFFGISDPRFAWAGVYTPDYPDHYLDKVASLPGQTYLGWNGTWCLNFDVPVFTWMHRQLALGWIYG